MCVDTLICFGSLPLGQGPYRADKEVHVTILRLCTITARLLRQLKELTSRSHTSVHQRKSYKIKLQTHPHILFPHLSPTTQFRHSPDSLSTMSAETLQQPIDAEAELEFALAEAELQAAAEVAETQAAEAEIKAAAEYLLAHPPSSPIDWFASPPALTLPPPVAPTIRTPPRLKLRSSAAVEEEGRNGKASKGRKGHKSRRITRASKMSEKDVNMSAESGSEVDELESPIDLNRKYFCRAVMMTMTMTRQQHQY